ILTSHYALHDARPIANFEELQLLARALVVQPASELDGFAYVFGQLSDGYPSHSLRILQRRPPMLASPTTMKCFFTSNLARLGLFWGAAWLSLGCGAVYPEVATPTRAVP